MSDASRSAGGAVAITADICNTRGLHARASAKFVKLASSFESEIHVIREGTTVDARSIMGLLMLGAGNGSQIDISAEGPDAAEAIQALGELVASRFGEDE
ncbi:HPr family phosphocarrier protein [soil metagenome]